MKQEENLLSLLNKGTSPHMVVEEALRQLKEAGFEEIHFEDTWNLEAGKKYVWNHHDTTFFAFTLPKDGVKEIRMAAAHTDYPGPRIKPTPDMKNGGYQQLNIECYGGMILNTWLDRPLGVSGRVALRGENPWKPKMVHYSSNRGIFTIPNLAIHMNREVNKGVELNKQVDMLPIFGLEGEVEKEEGFLDFLAEELKVSKEDILDYELALYCTEKAECLGKNQELLSSPRLDNLTSVQAVLDGIKEASDQVLCIGMAFDHEEVGSKTKQGAGSSMLSILLDRIGMSLGIDREEMMRLIYQGILLSVDVAHGLHPNQMGKADPSNRPVLGKGACIKIASGQSYATDAQALAIIKGLCQQKEIPFQIFVNRSDIPGGSTLGSIASSFLPVRTVDLGVPILAMHSARELMGRADMDSLSRMVTTFFQE